MIVLVGETTYQDRVKKQLQDCGYVEEKTVTHLIANAMKNSSRDNLRYWLTNNQAAKTDIETLFSQSTTTYGEWLARMESLNANTGGNWFIHDCRPFWFWDDFVKAAGGDVRVIAIWEDSDDSYIAALRHFLESKLPKGTITLTKRPTYGEIKKLLVSEKK
jgi:hypothetical protein